MFKGNRLLPSTDGPRSCYGDPAKLLNIPGGSECEGPVFRSPVFCKDLPPRNIFYEMLTLVYSRRDGC